MANTTGTRRALKAAAAIAFGGLVALSAVATSADADTPRPAHTRFVIFEPFDQGTTTQVDVGSPGFGPGDSILERHPALDAETGEELGTVVRDLRVVETYDDGDFLFAVSATFKLGRGDIHAAGAACYSDVAAGQAVVAVTGGTGSYARSAGTVIGRLGTRDGHDGVYLTFDIARTP